MSQALNLFTDSYLKRLKRPELFNYNADQSFGANMVHGSEEQNPFANRDQNNAKFGNLGGNTNKVVQGPQVFAGDQIDPSLGGKTFTLPNSQSPPSQDALDTIMGTITRPVGEYLGKNAVSSISNWLNPISSPDQFVDKMGEMGGGYKQLASSMIGLDQPSGDALEGIGKEFTRDSTSMLKGAIEGSPATTTGFSFDPVSMGLSVVPAVGKMLGLKGTAGDALGAATGVGAAALQGGLNPLADVGALMSVFKLIRGLF